MGIPGNHESAANYTHFKMRFASVAENAGVNSGSGTNMFFSFNDGLIHFVMWDSEVRPAALPRAPPRHSRR